MCSWFYNIFYNILQCFGLDCAGVLSSAQAGIGNNSYQYLLVIKHHNGKQVHICIKWIYIGDIHDLPKMYIIITLLGNTNVTNSYHYPL